MGVLRMWCDLCGWGQQVGGRVIPLICESCQSPLEDESLSGRVTYSDSAHTRWGSVVMASCREHLFSEVL